MPKLSPISHPGSHPALSNAGEGGSDAPDFDLASPTSTVALAALAGEINTLLIAARPRLLHLARLQGLSPDMAEDVAQDASLIVWRSLDQLRTPARFDAWVDGIARNISRRYLQAQRTELNRTAMLLHHESTAGTETAEVPAGLAEAESAEIPDLGEALSRQELATLLDRALSHLTPGARAAVEECYLDEHSSQEAARRLGVTINALETRLSRARQELRRILSGPLRDEAEAFDLALDDESEEGWRHTRLWCHQCGKRQLMGLRQETAAGPDFTMRCPDCWRRYGIAELHYEPHPLLQGVRSFRPAFKRFVVRVVPIAIQALQGPLACPICGAPARSRLRAGEDIAQFSPAAARRPAFMYLTVECTTCGPTFASPSAIAGSADTLVRDFMLSRSRWVLEANELATFQCSPVLRNCLVDYETGARLIFFIHPETLEVLASFAE
jgi:RNA polymerase sigma factor (sigma-70 family)